jgi:ribosomal protein S7
MATSPEVRAQFDAVLRSGAFHDPKTIERLVDRLMKSGKVDLALELLELASADPRLERQWKNISDIRERLLDSKMPRF